MLCQILLGFVFYNDRFNLVSNQKVSNNRLVGINCSFELLSLRAIDFEVGLKVVALSVLLNRVGECSLAPNICARYFAADTGYQRSDFLYGLGTLLFVSITTENPNSFVLSQRSTVFF